MVTVSEFKLLLQKNLDELKWITKGGRHIPIYGKGEKKPSGKVIGRVQDKNGKGISFEISKATKNDATKFEAKDWAGSRFGNAFQTYSYYKSQPVTVLKDKKGTIMGAMMFSRFDIIGDKKYAVLSYLETAPGVRQKNVKGVGTTLMLNAMKQSKENGYEGRIMLSPVKGAEGFYSKLGFKETGKGSWSIDETSAQKLLDTFGD